MGQHSCITQCIGLQSSVSLKEAPIEILGSIKIVEDYHSPLRFPINNLISDLGTDDATYADFLQMAAYSMNATMGPDGLFSMLLVFGALPRPARSHPAPTQLSRQQAMESSKTAV